MILSPVGPAFRLRLAWTLRLTMTRLRGGPGVTVLVVSAFALATLSAILCAAFGVAMREQSAAGRAAGTGNGAQLIAFLHDDLPDSSRDALADALGKLPGVAVVRVLGSDEALARMRADLGERASVLDGVEEGFLPTTLEISLRPGSEGVGRADAIAWRLRRMDGVTDVDVLRTVADQRLAEGQVLARRLGVFGLVLGLATTLLALGLAAAAMRRRRTDASILAGLGFTTAAIAAPASIAGAVVALVGSVVGLLFGSVVSVAIGYSWSGVFTLGRAGQVRWAGGTLVALAAVAVGALLGWWGARPSDGDGETLAPAV